MRPRRRKKMPAHLLGSTSLACLAHATQGALATLYSAPKCTTSRSHLTAQKHAHKNVMIVRHEETAQLAVMHLGRLGDGCLGGRCNAQTCRRAIYLRRRGQSSPHTCNLPRSAHRDQHSVGAASGLVHVREAFVSNASNKSVTTYVWKLLDKMAKCDSHPRQ